MKIKINPHIPDSTYFRMSDVEPTPDQNTLTVYDGHGSRRSWGKPEVSSTVIVNTATFTAVHVGFHHKHRGSQGWFYFVNGERKHWNQLSAYRQRQVLASAHKAPGWAKHPGKKSA